MFTKPIEQRSRAAIAVCLWLAAAWPVAAAEFLTVKHRVESSAAPGQYIHVREKMIDGTDPKAAGKAVLFVHGATYPGATFDLAVAGYNWMEYVAARGYVAYYLDVRGYGHSSRPPELEQPAGQNQPVMRASDAAKDIADVVGFIRQRSGLNRIDIIAWSWGTVTSGLFASQHPEQVRRLVLFAPVYALARPDRLTGRKLADPTDITRFNPALGAYRLVDAAAMEARWDEQIVAADKDEWRERHVLDSWVASIMATDPDRGKHRPAKFRAPNGVLVDVFEIFSGRPIYPAEAITMPTLIVRGDADTDSVEDDARGLFARLGAREKEYVLIENASHFMNLEKTAAKLHEAAQAFLER